MTLAISMQSFEAGISKDSLRRTTELFILDNKSETVSIFTPLLPAGFLDARKFSPVSQISKANPANSELAQESAGATTYPAAMMRPGAKFWFSF
jgi:hypothetical protein